QPGCACDWHPIFLRFQHHPHAFSSRIEPVSKPCGSRCACHCHVDLSNRSAVAKMALKVPFAKQKQLAQKTVGSRDHSTSRVCSGLVDGVAQGCNIGSPVALAYRVDTEYTLFVTITWSFDAYGVLGERNGPDSCILAVAGRSVAARRHRAA